MGRNGKLLATQTTQAGLASSGLACKKGRQHIIGSVHRIDQSFTQEGLAGVDEQQPRSSATRQLRPRSRARLLLRPV